MKTDQKIILLAFLSVGMLFSCSRSIDVEQEKTALLETDQMFAEASRNEGAAEAFHQFLADDALQFNAGGPVVRSNQTIYQRMMKNSNPSIILDWEPAEANVSESGDLGYTWGRYTVFRKDSASTDLQPLAYGKYVNVWEKQDDGSWKVKIDIGNDNPAPEGD